MYERATVAQGAPRQGECAWRPLPHPRGFALPGVGEGCQKGSEYSTRSAFVPLRATHPGGEDSDKSGRPFEVGVCKGDWGAVFVGFGRKISIFLK